MSEFLNPVAHSLVHEGALSSISIPVHSHIYLFHFGGPCVQAVHSYIFLGFMTGARSRFGVSLVGFFSERVSDRQTSFSGSRSLRQLVHGSRGRILRSLGANDAASQRQTTVARTGSARQQRLGAVEQHRRFRQQQFGGGGGNAKRWTSCCRRRRRCRGRRTGKCSSAFELDVRCCKRKCVVLRRDIVGIDESSFLDRKSSEPFTCIHESAFFRVISASGVFDAVLCSLSCSGGVT